MAGHMSCGHEGTVWHIKLVDSPAENLDGWECTRCGQRWDRDPMGSTARL